MDQVDNMYKIGLERLKREEKEDLTDALRIKHVEEAEEKAYRQWEEHNQRSKALIQKRKNDREQERSMDRTFAEMIKLRNQELDIVDAKEREENR